MATGVHPVVRSRSPIAEQDQRIGIPGFGSPSFDQSTSFEGPFEDALPAARSYDSAVAPPTKTSVTGSRPLETTDPAPAAKTDLATSKSMVGTPIVTRPAIEAPHDISVTTSSPALLDTPAAVNDTPAPLYKTVVSRGEGIKTSTEARLEWTENSSSANVTQIDELDSSFAKSGEASPTRLEPTPRVILSPGPREPTLYDAFQTSDRIEQEPRVVIGRINVEVVQPAGEIKTTAPPRPGPLTAESVSVIGPLSRRVGSSLRLNLKYR
jgi:hypothetical protein